MSNAVGIDLADFLERHRQEDLAATVDFQGLFSACVGYLSQRELLQARRRSLRPDESGAVDPQERFLLELAGLVRGWQGLNLEVLCNLTNVQIPEGVDASAAIPCTPANVAAMFSEVPAFFEFVLAKASDLAALRRARAEEELKN
jgi:hypothetical protein